jgi:hypothetical protein
LRLNCEWYENMLCLFIKYPNICLRLVNIKDVTRHQIKKLIIDQKRWISQTTNMVSKLIIYRNMFDKPSTNFNHIFQMRRI